MKRERIFFRNGNRIYSLLIILFYTLNVNSQVSVSGTVVSEANEPMSFVKVVLLNADSTVKVGAMADLEGKFELTTDQGNYILEVREVSETIYSQPLSISVSQSLGLIKIAVNAQELNEVEVSVKKQVIVRKVDRLVFNVEHSIAVRGGTAMDALRITPGVRVQNDVISMVGKSTVLIMVNDRMLQLSKDDLVNFLTTIAADNIAKIEVITTPPAQYAAEGNSGIINIVLIHAKRDRWNAGLGASTTQRTYLGGAVNGNFNFNKNKLSFQSSVSVGNSNKEITDKNTTNYTSETWSARSPRKVDYKYLSAQAAIDYKFSSKWKAGVQYLGSFSDMLISGTSHTNRTAVQSGNLTGQIESESKAGEIQGMHSGNFHVIFTPDTLNTRISLDADYFTFQSLEDRALSGNFLDANANLIAGSYFGIASGNENSMENYSGRMDVEIPRKWGVLSFGTKYAQSQTKNALELYNTSTGKPVLDVSQSNRFDYLERNTALYLSFSKELGTKWAVQGGLRSEFTETTGYSETYDQTTINNYNKLFPTAYISYKPNDQHFLSISYGRRINRPNYEQLNPFRWYDSPFVFGEGNPFLKPSFSDNLEVNHSFKNFNTSVFLVSMTNGFDQFGMVNPQTNTTNFLVLNFYDSKSIGLSESYVFDKVKWWTSTNSLAVSYAVTTAKNAFTPQRTEGFQSSVSSDNNFVLNKKKTLHFNVNFWHGFPGVMNVFTFSNISSLSAAINFSALENKLQLTLSADDILKTSLFKARTVSNGVAQSFANYYDNRLLRLSIRYTFGSRLLKVDQNKFGNEDEQNRVGN